MHHHHYESFSAAMAVAITYTICTILALIFPTQALKVFAAIMHVPAIEQWNIAITLSSYVTGLITLFIWTYVLVWIAACTYHCYYKRI